MAAYVLYYISMLEVPCSNQETVTQELSSWLTGCDVSFSNEEEEDNSLGNNELTDEKDSSGRPFSDKTVILPRPQPLKW